MAKSIISGLGLLAVVTAIVLWLFGLYELSAPGALALGFVGFVLAIFFARFGGFKPFFSTVETPPWYDDEQEAVAFNPTFVRPLAGVGADPTGPESLFDERNPDHLSSVRTGSPIFDEADDGDNDAVDTSEAEYPPLFGEALSEQLASDRASGEPLFDERVPERVSGGETDASGFLRGLQAGEEEAADRAEPLSPPLEIDVDVDPEWAGADADVDLEDIDLEDIDTEDLAASLDALEPSEPSQAAVDIDYVAEPMVMESTGLAEAGGTELPVVVENPVPLELHKYTSSEIMSVVKSQEGVLVDTLIDEGVLSTSGPLTDKDIRTMVFVAVSSNELIDVLTQAQQEAVALNGGGEHAIGTGD